MHDTFDKDNYMESGRPEDVEGELFPGTVTSATAEGNVARLSCDNGASLEIHACSGHVVKFRFSTDGKFDDGFSYATLAGAFPDPPQIELVNERDRIKVLIEPDGLIIFIARTGLTLRIENRERKLISEDEKGFHWRDNEEYGGEIVLNSRYIQSREHFFGLGDKSCSLDLRGRRLFLWGSDTYGYTDETDPLYKNIPFFIGTHHGHAYGFFFDNSFRSSFDFGMERNNTASFWSQGGNMDYYFFYGPSIMEVVTAYTSLTGTPEMPPMWALGYHQCKWSYKTETELKAICKQFRELEIPCDAIYLDIDYMDGFRCFTWNHESFPDPAKMVRELGDDGFKTVAIIDPGIKIDPGYSIYEDGLANDVFCRRMDGPHFGGNVWPGECYFPDFTSPAVRDWWSGLFGDLIANIGLAGIWNDMNEPAVFNDHKTFPRDVRHDYDGHSCSHRKAHNVYGMQMVRATLDGLKRSAPDRRPFLITRSGFSGVQRFSSAWTGDNVANWAHLRIANIQCQRLSLSGISFVGSDIGGFLEKPEGELYIRWLQMGIFHPLCRTHSSGEQGDQEPWSFGEPFTAIARKFIELRYRLIPYHYTAFRKHLDSGHPIIRSLFCLDDQDPETYHRVEEFGVGDDLLVCPISKPGLDGRWLYPPRGKWYDYWTDELFDGGDEIYVDAPLDQIPLFIRAGATVPLAPVMQYVGAAPVSELELHVYHPGDGEKGVSHLFEDSGDGYGHVGGDRVMKSFTTEAGLSSLAFGQQRDGGFAPEYSTYRVVFHGLPEKPTACVVDGKTVKINSTDKCYSVSGVPESFTSLQLEASTSKSKSQ